MLKYFMIVAALIGALSTLIYAIPCSEPERSADLEIVSVTINGESQNNLDPYRSVTMTIEWRGGSWATLQSCSDAVRDNCVGTKYSMPNR